MIINKLFSYLNMRSPILIQTPAVCAYGNIAEDMYHGLLKARRENKKVLFLFPHNLFWIFRWSKVGINRELVKIESNYRFLAYNNIFGFIGDWFITVVFCFFKILEILGRKIFKYQLNDDYILPSIGRSGLFYDENRLQFNYEDVKQGCWNEQFSNYLKVQISSKKK